MATTLYDPAINADPLASGFLAYAQLPASPTYPSPLSSPPTYLYTPIPSLFDSAIQTSNGITLDTNGTVFGTAAEFNFITQLPTGSFFPADANTGYAGFTNYTIDFSNLNYSDIAGSLTLEPVNGAFPILDPNIGFTIAFDLAILQESSANDRAGFSLLVVTSDASKEIELGFTTNGIDRVFAQQASFGEAENTGTTPLDFTTTKTYWLSVSGETYSLAANGVQILTGSLRDYAFDPTTSDPPLPAQADPYDIPNLVFFGDNTDQAHAEFTLGKISVLSLQTDLNAETYDDYLASNLDLIAAFGYDLDAAKDHYTQFGFQEGRPIDTFAEDIYLASNSDLIAAFGYDLDAATQHFIQSGVNETRSLDAFDPAAYLAAYQDLQVVFGSDFAAATKHYIEFGFTEGRGPLIGLDAPAPGTPSTNPQDFDAGAYIASHQDLINAFGYNLDAGRDHYFQFGILEGRTITFEADDYIASHGDLIQFLGYDLDAGTEHYIRFGAGEGRAADTFNEVAYLNNYPDLQAAFGSDLNAATKHFIESGFFEGRVA